MKYLRWLIQQQKIRWHDGEAAKVEHGSLWPSDARCRSFDSQYLSRSFSRNLGHSFHTPPLGGDQE